MSAWFGVFHPSSQGIMPGIDRRLAYSPEPCVQVQGSQRRCVSLWANWHLDSYRSGTPDQRAGPQDKDSAWVLSAHLPPPTTAPLSHTRNKALSVPEQGRQHKLDNPNQSTLSLTVHRLGQGEREGSREVRLWSVRGKSESDSQSSAMRAPFESLQGGPNSWTISREGERISQPESETKRHPPLNFPLASLGRSRSSGATVVTERRKTRQGH